MVAKQMRIFYASFLALRSSTAPSSQSKTSISCPLTSMRAPSAPRDVNPRHRSEASFTCTAKAFVSLCDSHYMVILERASMKLWDFCVLKPGHVIWSCITAHGRATVVDVTEGSACVNYLGCRRLASLVRLSSMLIFANQYLQ